MKFTGLLIAFTITIVYGWNDGVIKFNMDDVKDPSKLLSDILLHNSRQKLQLSSWSYTNCGNPSKDLVVLSDLKIGPDPLSFPGDLLVQFNALIKTTVDAPLLADVVIEKKIGSTYLKIPCIGGVGSCHYDDLCDLLSGATCPPPFVTNNVPCKCPFNKGSYTFPQSKFEVLAAVFPPGDYIFQGNLTYNNNQVACVNLTATFD